MILKEWYIWTYRGPEIIVRDFVGTFLSQLKSSGGESPVSQFLNWSIDIEAVKKQGGTTSPLPSSTNLKTIESQVLPEEMKILEDENNKENLPIKTGTPLIVAKKYFSPFMKRDAGVQPSRFDYATWWNKTQKDLLEKQDGEYSPVQSLSLNSNTWSQLSLGLRVWYYCKARSEFWDITPFVILCTTQKQLLGGQFVINIRSLPSTLNNSESLIQRISPVKGEIIDKDLLETYGQDNDIVFIRFEQLRVEGYHPTSSYKFVREESELFRNESGSQRMWDFIGFVDRISTSYTEESRTVQISGSDITKLFSLDVNYFLLTRYIAGNNNYIYGGSSTSITRIYSGYTSFWFNYEHPVRESVEFVVDHIATLGVVPSSVFSSYTLNRTKEKKLINEGTERETTVETEAPAKGIWGITRVVADEYSQNRSLYSSFWKDSNSSVMTLLSSICVSPFIELKTDVYTNFNEIIIRRPPFTKSDIDNVLSKKLYINIDMGNLISMNLSFDERSYNWFKLQAPNLFGQEQSVPEIYTPTVFFDELAYLFGCRQFNIQDVYIPKITGNDDTANNTFYEMGIDDLTYIIETHIHLPFTRRGTLTIEGDRRIKVGSYVKLSPTNELFYVTAVTQEFQANGNTSRRTTTLSVERGMVVSVLEKGLPLTPRKGYFEIANISGISLDLKSRLSGLGTVDGSKGDSSTEVENAKYGLNKDVLDQFLKRSQFN